MGVILGTSFLLSGWGNKEAVDFPLRGKHILDSSVVLGLLLGAEKPCKYMLMQKTKGTWQEAVETTPVMIYKS